MAHRPEPEFTLDEQLCFALHSASRAMTSAYRDGLTRIGLTYPQYLVMLLLWEHHHLPMGQLGERLHLDSATLSPLLKRMATQQLITRRRSAEDERILEVTATAAGHDLRARARAVQADVEHNTGLSAAELAAMRTDLHRMAARLRDPTTVSQTR